MVSAQEHAAACHSVIWHSQAGCIGRNPLHVYLDRKIAAPPYYVLSPYYQNSAGPCYWFPNAFLKRSTASRTSSLHACTTVFRCWIEGLSTLWHGLHTQRRHRACSGSRRLGSHAIHAARNPSSRSQACQRHCHDAAGAGEMTERMPPASVANAYRLTRSGKASTSPVREGGRTHKALARRPKA
jgi:hypothetical protein